MNKRKIVQILFVLIGISLISYPIISSLVNSYTQTTCTSNYQDIIRKMGSEEKRQKLEEAKNYNEQLKEDEEIDISLESKPVERKYLNYYNVLNIGETIGYVSIPKIDVYLPIYHGVSEGVLQSGVGHIESTSLPIGGKGTHAVLAGHTGLAKQKVFDNIDKLEIGDEFFINVLDEKLAYRVDKIDVVEPEDVSSLGIDPEKDYITLVTCTPYMVNTHRLLVRGERIDISESKSYNEFIVGSTKDLDTDKLKEKKSSDITLATTAIILASTILIIYILKTKKEKIKRLRLKINHYKINLEKQRLGLKI